MAEVDRVWYLRKEGEKGSVGPFSTEQLLARWQKGELDRKSEGWREGMLDWRPLLDIEPFTSAARVSLDVTGVIRFYCECNNEIVMAERFAGRLAKCSVCGREVRVPDPYARFDEDEAKEDRDLPRWLIPAGAVVGLIVVAAVALQLLGVNWMGLSDSPDGGSGKVAKVDDPPTTPDGAGGAGHDPATNDPGASGDPSADGDGQKQNQPGTTDNIDATGVRTRIRPPNDAEKVQTSIRADERAVQKLASEFFAAFRTKNPTSLERLTDLLTEDCSITHGDETVVTGRDANLVKFMMSIEKAKSRYRAITVRLGIESATVDGDTAVVTGKLERDGQIAGRSRPEETRSSETIEFVRADGTWKITKITSVPIERGGGAAG